MNNKGQMMIFELIFFATTVILALIFLYQISPSSVTTSTYTDDIKVLGDTALYSIYNTPPNAVDYPNGFPPSRMVQYLLNASYGNFVSDLKNMLPATLMFNIYITDSRTITQRFWCNSYASSSEPLPTLDPVTISHCIVAIHPEFWECYGPGKPFPEWNLNYMGSVYDVQLEMWYI